MTYLNFLLLLLSVAIGKAQAAYAQSFALWQQAIIEFTCHDHSIIACSRHVYILLFFVHIPFVVNHTFNATPLERLQHKFLILPHIMWIFFQSVMKDSPSIFLTLIALAYPL